MMESPMPSAISIKPGFADFPVDQWYVAAFSDEVTSQDLLSRKICDQPMALFRKSNGEPVALFDRCPHRGLPFSAGHLVAGDRVKCGYHGFEFDGAGRCVRIPAQDDIPPQIAVPSFPVVERWNWLWVWPGDPAKADPALIPDHDELGLTREGWNSNPGVALHAKANYLLMVENLIDATHIGYLHSNPKFGANQHMDDEERVARAPYKLEQAGDVIRMVREFENERARTVGRVVGGVPRDRTLALQVRAPQTVVIGNTWRPSGTNQPPFASNLIVMITPESRTSCWKFTAFAHNSDQRLFNDSNEAITELLSQDVRALEMIQARTNELGLDRCPEVSQRADAGGLQYRRALRRMMEHERNSAVRAE